MMEWLDIVIFTLGGKPVLLVDFISSLLGLTCVFLAGRNSKYNFWVGYLYTAALFFLFWSRNLYANLLLQPISLAINVFGHWRWTHPKEEERSSEDANKLKVSMLTWPQRGFTVAAILVIALLWGWVMKTFFPANPAPYLDCCVTVLILTAQLPGPVPGLLRDGPDPHGAAPVGAQEVGLLDGLAHREHHPDHSPYQRGERVHAHRLRPVPGERPVVAVFLDEIVQEKWINCSK